MSERAPPLGFAFLLYVSRSGSTMLANKVARSMPQVVVFPELDVPGTLFTLGDAAVAKLGADELGDLLRGDPKWPDLQLTDTDLEQIVAASVGRGVEAVLTELSLVYARALKRPVPACALFQRGTLLGVVPEIVACIDRARFVHLVRDPRAAVSSIVKLRQSASAGAYDTRAMGRADALGLARNWRRYVTRAAAMGQRFEPRVLELDYETLCADLDSALATVSAHLGVERANHEAPSAALAIDQAQTQLHKNIHSAPILERAQAWQTELAPWRGVVVETAAGQAMQQRGYAPFFASQASGSKRLAYRAYGRLEFVAGSVRPALRRARQVLRSPAATLRVWLRRASDRLAGD